MSVPSVNVIIPAYNSAQYTVEAVESVLQQTYADREIIVVDDGSTDNTNMLLRPYLDRIKYVYQKNRGASNARNCGIRLSTGAFVACLDCDDLWMPDKLEKSISLLQANPGMGFVFTACYRIDANGAVTGVQRARFDESRVYHQLLGRNFILSPTVVIRRSCLEEVGLFDEKIFIPADWDLWLRLSRRFPVGYIDFPFSKYRTTSDYQIRHIGVSLEECIYVLQKQLRGSPRISSVQKSRLMADVFRRHGRFYQKALDGPHARNAFWKALKRDPYNWRNYFYFASSLLGIRLSFKIHEILVSLWRRANAGNSTVVICPIRNMR